MACVIRKSPKKKMEKEEKPREETCSDIQCTTGGYNMEGTYGSENGMVIFFL